MFSILKKLLFARQLTFEEGEIDLLGNSIVMTPTVLFIELFKQLKKSQPKTYGDIIYNITKGVGKNYSEVLKKKYKFDTRKLIEWDVNTLSLAGLGKGKLMNYDFKKKKAVIRVFNSAIAKKLYPSKEAVDYAIAGYIGGSATVIYNSKKMYCMEVKCKAKGEGYCEFLVFEKKGK